MKPVRLGQSGLRVSPLCLGTMNFGAGTDLDTARQIADLCFDAGVFFWDTADMYGRGTSERMCAELLKGRRNEIVLATKAWAAMSDAPNDRGLSARHLIEACDASLQRLGTDWIDLYYLHLPDRDVPLDETLRAMEDLVRSGRVRYVGCSNYWAWEIMELLGTAKQHGWQPMTAVQPVYNLCNRTIEVEMLPMTRAKGLGVVSYSPLARGVLTGKYRWDEEAPSGSRLAAKNTRFLQAEWRRESVEVAQSLTSLAEARGWSTAQLATGWVLANPNVHSVIMGPKTIPQAREYLAAAQTPWDPELEQAIDALVPPGRHTGRPYPDPSYSPVTGRSRTM